LLGLQAKSDHITKEDVLSVAVREFHDKILQDIKQEQIIGIKYYNFRTIQEILINLCLNFNAK